MLWFNNFFNPRFVFSPAKYDIASFSIWLNPLEEVVQQSAILFNRKKVKLSYKKFRNEKRGKILTCGKW